MRQPFAIESPEDAIEAADAIAAWAEDNAILTVLGEAESLVGEIKACIENCLGDMADDQNERNLAEWAETGKTNLSEKK